MFTGIVEALGTVAERRSVDFGAVLLIDRGAWPHEPKPGDSVAVNGVCLTATDPGEENPNFLRFDVIQQTLRTTTLGELGQGSPVNLEYPVSASSMLGGHIVQGHVDGVGTVVEVVKDESEWRLRVEPPTELLPAIVEKGSVALDGVSLTVATLADRTFEVALIPTTLEITTLGRAEIGTKLNIETDYIAKTVINWLQRQKEGIEGLISTPTPA